MSGNAAGRGELSGALIALALSLTCARASAQQLAPPRPPAQPLVLEAPCITGPQLEARVQPLLPEKVAASSILQDVQVRVRPAELEHEVQIELPARAGQAAIRRTLRGESCETVVDAAILVIGLWVSEAAQAAPPPPPPPPPPSPPPPQDDGELEPVRWSVELGGTASSRLLPSTALAIEAAGALSWYTARVTLGARYWPAQSEGSSNERVEGELFEGDLQLAWFALELGAFQLGPSAGLVVGRLRVAGLGVTDPKERTLTWLRSELAAHARLSLPGGPFALWLRAGVALPWSRPRVEIGGAGTVFRPAAVAPYAGLGLELSFR